jgi:hypothetical protein
VHGLDDGWNIAVGVAQKFPGLTTPPSWPEQWASLVVAAVQQDRQEQAVIDVAGVAQRRPIQHPKPHGGIESSAPHYMSLSRSIATRCSSLVSKTALTVSNQSFDIPISVSDNLL